MCITVTVLGVVGAREIFCEAEASYVAGFPVPLPLPPGPPVCFLVSYRTLAVKILGIFYSTKRADSSLPEPS